MYRQRAARSALLVALALTCGCASRGDRPGFFERLRSRMSSSSVECCPTAVPVSTSFEHMPVATAAPPACGCDVCADGTCDGPFLGAPSGIPMEFSGVPMEFSGIPMESSGIPIVPADPLPYGQSDPYQQPPLNIPRPLPPAAGIEEGEAQPFPADGASRRGVGSITNKSKPKPAVK